MANKTLLGTEFIKKLLKAISDSYSFQLNSPELSKKKIC